MSSISENPFWWGWDNARQNRAINQVAAESASRAQRDARRNARMHREMQNNLRNEISGVQGRLNEVLAVIELRFQLAEFDEYQVRVNARKTFRALAAGAMPGHLELFDVGGYWMPPAALAIRDLIQATGVDMQHNLDLARDRDRLRTELLSLSAGICFDQQLLMPPAITYLLSQAPDFGASPSEVEEESEAGDSSDSSPAVAHGWRQLWIQSVRGDFGITPQQQIATRLSELMESEPEELPANELAPWVEAMWNLTDANDRRDPESVSEVLQALKSHIESSLAQPSIVSDASSELHEVDLEQWQHFLQELIEEPSEAEKPVLSELAALGAQTHSVGDLATWQESEGSLRELLLHDALEVDGDPTLRAVAARLALPWLLQAAEAMVKRASAVEEISRTVGEHSSKVTVTKNGATAEDIARAERRLTDATRPDMPTTSSQATVAGISIGLCVLFAAAGLFGWAFFSLFLLAIPVARYVRATKEAEAGEEYYAQRLKKLKDDINTAKVEIAEEERRRSRAASGLTEELAALRQLQPSVASRPSSILSSQSSASSLGNSASTMS